MLRTTRLAPRPAALAAGLALALLAPAARADVSSELPPKASVKSTLVPAGETEVFRVDAVAGSTLDLSLSAKKKEALTSFDVELRGPDDELVDLSSASDTGKKFSVKKLVLMSSGTYTLTVGGEGTGEYSLSLTVGAPKKAEVDPPTIDAAETVQVAFAAPSGASVTLKAKAPKKSPATPRFGMFQGEDLSTLGALKPTAHTVKVVVGEGGDLMVPLTNTGSGSDTITVTITIKAAKSKKAKLDVRAEELGFPGGGETFLGVLVDGAAGGDFSVDDAATGLDGAGVSVPAGAFEGTALVSLADAPAEPVEDIQRQTAGPTLTVGALGVTSFDQPVTLTLPFDSQQLPLATDGDDVSVQELTGKNTVTTLVPDAVDERQETVSVSLGAPARLTPTVRRGSPRLDGRTYWLLGQDTEHEPGKLTSHTRRVARIDGLVSFVGDGSGTFSVSGTEYETTLTTQPGDGSGFVESSANPIDAEEGGGFVGAWEYQPDGQRIVTDVGGEDEQSFYVSHDGRMLLNSVVRDPSDTTTTMELFLQKADTPPSMEAVAGTYHVFDMRFDVFEQFDDLQNRLPLGMAGANSAGTFTLDADGTFRIPLTERESVFEAGPAFERGVGKGTVTGTWSVEKDGSVRVVFDPDEPGDPQEIEFFYPNADNTVIMGSAPEMLPPLSEGLHAWAVLVRQGSGLGPASLTGDYALVSQQLEYRSDSVGNVQVPDFEAVTIEDILAFDGSKAVNSTDPYDRIIRRDDGQPGGLIVETSTEDLGLGASFKLSGNGTFTIGEGGAGSGAVSPAGDFAFVVLAPSIKEDVSLGLMLLKLPPEQIMR